MSRFRSYASKPIRLEPIRPDCLGCGSTDLCDRAPVLRACEPCHARALALLGLQPADGGGYGPDGWLGRYIKALTRPVAVPA
jgi:hypothetical protein